MITELYLSIIGGLITGAFGVWQWSLRSRAEQANQRAQIELERVKTQQESDRNDTQVQLALMDLLRNANDVAAKTAVSIDANTRVLSTLADKEDLAYSQINGVKHMLDAAQKTMAEASVASAKQRSRLTDQIREGNGQILGVLADVLKALDNLSRQITIGMITPDVARDLSECRIALQALIRQSVTPEPAPQSKKEQESTQRSGEHAVVKTEGDKPQEAN